MFSAWLGLAVLAAVGGVWAFRRAGREPWLGPMFRFQLTRLARRGRQPWFRAAYVLVLLLALFGLYASEFRDDTWLTVGKSPTYSRADTARFAQKYLILFLFAQAAAVVSLTPVMVGGAMAGGQSWGAFELLRASSLSDRELVLGSLTAGLVAVGSVMAAGVPVLALTLLFGGVDGVVLACGFAIAVLAALGLGAVTVWLAVTRDKLGDVLMNVYSWAAMTAGFGIVFGWIPGVGAISPFSALAYMLVEAVNVGPTTWEFWVNVGGFVGLSAVTAVAFTRMAVKEVRRPYSAEEAMPTRRADGMPIRQVPTSGKAVGAKTEIDLALPPIERPPRRAFTVAPLRDEDPLRWREREFGSLGGTAGQTAGCGLLAICTVGVAFTAWLMLAVILTLAEGWDPGKSVIVPVRVIAVSTVLVGGLAAGITASGSVARERDMQTLDSLLMVPIRRTEILRAKAWAAFEQAKAWLYTAGTVVAIGLVTGAVHPAGAAGAAAVAAGYVSFTLALGMWTSVRARTVSAAGIWFVLGMLATGALPLAASFVLPRHSTTLAYAAFPPVGTWEMLFPWRAEWDTKVLPAATGGLIGSTVCLLMGLALWRDAVRRFRLETCGEPTGNYLDG